MAEQLESLTPELEQQGDEDTVIQDCAEEIEGTLVMAFDLLIERRDSQYEAATAPLNAELEALQEEHAAIGVAARDLERLLPARAREAQRQADALTLAGHHEEARVKLAEAEEAANAPAAMKQRQREISARVEAIENEKRTIARRILEQWYPEAQSIVRACEKGFFLGLLDGLERDSYDFQQRTDTATNPLLQQNRLAGLTADEHSIEWKLGQKWYGGRR